MNIVRSVIASTITAAVLATSVTPAMAQGYPGGGYNNGYGNRGYGNHGHDRYRRHNRGVSAGDVIAGVAIIGVLAAIAGAASSSPRNRNGGYQRNAGTEDQAADACTARFEQNYGARVRTIEDVQRTRDGYQVRGVFETNVRDDRDAQRFTCSVRYGQVEDVRIDSGYAYQGY